MGYPARVSGRDGVLLRLELPDRSEAPSAARKALTALNSLDLISAPRRRDVQLLAELVSNALRHGGRAGAPIALTVRAIRRVLRVEVSDQGDGFDPVRLRAPARTHGGGGGWGVPIVAALADRWGVDRSAATTVWFEIDRPPQPAPPPAECSAAR